MPPDQDSLVSAPATYLVVSDLHLCDAEEHADGWRWYKSARYHIDEPFAELLSRTVAGLPSGGRLVLVLNGDIVDFDLVTAIPDKPPWPVWPWEYQRGLAATDRKSVWKLEQVLKGHPRFLSALAGLLAGGHRVVYVMGNHDREFYFPKVREAFTGAVRRAAATAGTELPAGCIEYEPWFFHVPGLLYAEHGQQYDHYNSFSFLLHPTVTEGGNQEIALPMGNLSNRFLTEAMGFFNPHSGDFILNAYAYLAHWLRHYAFSRRSLVMSWLIGSLFVIHRLLTQKGLMLLPRRHYLRLMEAESSHHGLSPRLLRAIDRLRRPPIANRLYRMLREFWIDRLAILGAMVWGGLAILFLPLPVWAKVMIPLSGFPLLFFVYEFLARGENIFTFEKEFPHFARCIGELLSVRLVTFGHAHQPRLIPLAGDRTFVDTGTWAPIFRKDDPQRLADGHRTYLLVETGRAGVAIGLHSWPLASGGGVCACDDGVSADLAELLEEEDEAGFPAGSPGV